jgi:hypothetical protein
VLRNLNGALYSINHSSPEWGSGASGYSRILFVIWQTILYSDQVINKHLTRTLGGFEMSEEYPVVDQPDTFLVH